jgi:sulfur relay (sulfurtransferase) complex TusBCD TusD component (DsrE family)
MHQAISVALNKGQFGSLWQQLSSEYGFSLQTCPTSAEKYGLDVEQFAAGFAAGGMSHFADALLTSDAMRQYD